MSPVDEIERLSEGRDKTGVFLGVHAINPVDRERIPVYAADYVLADYGTGAIMAVPGQDQRDWDFADRFDLPIVRTVQPPDDFDGEAYTGDGPAINSASDGVSLNGDGRRRGEASDHGVAGGTGAGARHGELPAARLADQPAALLGPADPRHPLRLLR